MHDQKFILYGLLMAKCKREPIEPRNQKTVRPVEFVHMDVLGPMKAKAVGNRSYTLGVIDDYTAYPDEFFLSNRGQVYEEMCKYMDRAERVTAHRFQSIRFDGAGEHKGEIVS